MFKVGDVVETKTDGLGIVTSINLGLVFPILVTFNNGMKRSFTLEGYEYDTKSLFLMKVEKPMFKVGDRVKCIHNGLGQVIGLLDNNTTAPVHVKFDSGKTSLYTQTGKLHLLANCAVLSLVQNYEFNQDIIDTIKDNKPVWFQRKPSVDATFAWFKLNDSGVNNFSLGDMFTYNWTTTNPFPKVTKTLTMYANIYNNGICCAYRTTAEANQTADATNNCRHTAIKLTGTYEEDAN